jgi:hypothetical protein
VRVREEYLLALLLQHRPLPADVAAELASYTIRTAELAPLFEALLRGSELDLAAERLAERLAEAMAGRPVVRPDRLAGVVHVCVLEIAREWQRRELKNLGQVLAEADHDTVREMDNRALEVMVHELRLDSQLVKAQAQHYRGQPVTSDGERA